MSGARKPTVNRIDDPLYGLSWNSAHNAWRIALAVSRENPGHWEYVCASRHGGKDGALIAAQARRDQLMKTPAMRKHYRYQIAGRRVKPPKSNGVSPPITGIVFNSGLHTGRKCASPRFIAYSVNEYLASFAMRTYGGREALELAARERWAREGRRFSRKAVNAAYDAWRTIPEVAEFMAEHRIPD